MPKQPKLRIFAGPNGSGKTTVFESIKEQYFYTRLFINADLLEEAFKRFNFINLSDFEISIDNEKFQDFCFNSSLFLKARFEESTWRNCLLI